MEESRPKKSFSKKDDDDDDGPNGSNEDNVNEESSSEGEDGDVEDAKTTNKKQQSKEDREPEEEEKLPSEDGMYLPNYLTIQISASNTIRIFCKYTRTVILNKESNLIFNIYC